MRERLLLQRWHLRIEEDERDDLFGRESVPERQLRGWVLLQQRLRWKLRCLQRLRKPRKLHRGVGGLPGRSELLALPVQRGQRELSILVHG
jgi:hypothetical protein